MKKRPLEMSIHLAIAFIEKPNRKVYIHLILFKMILHCLEHYLKLLVNFDSFS